MKKISTSILIIMLTLGLSAFIFLNTKDPYPDLKFTYIKYNDNSEVYLVKVREDTRSDYIYIPGTYNGIKVEIDSHSLSGLPVKTLELGEGFKEIHTFSVYDSLLTKIILPSSLEYLGWFNVPIETVVFAPNSNLKHISDGFRGTNIKSIIIPKSVERIMGQVFRDTPYLEEVIFEEGSKLNEIGNKHAFYNTNLKSITLPKSVKKIRFNTFQDSTVKLYFEEGSQLEEIGELAFYNSSSLDYIPEGVKVIGKDAFSGAKLKEVVIPESVTYIGNLAFSRMPTLESIHMSDQIEFVGEYIFDQSNAVTIYMKGQNLIGYDPKWNDNRNPLEHERNIIYQS